MINLSVNKTAFDILTTAYLDWEKMSKMLYCHCIGIKAGEYDYVMQFVLKSEHPFALTYTIKNENITFISDKNDAMRDDYERRVGEASQYKPLEDK